jgi:hypothetical protein
MKTLITISLMLTTSLALCQFRLARADLFSKECDSLSKLYKKDVFGYTHTLTRGRESLIIFYTDDKQETNDTLVWTRDMLMPKRQVRKRN